MAVIKPEKLRIITDLSKVLKFEHYIMKIIQGEILSSVCQKKNIFESTGYIFKKRSKITGTQHFSLLCFYLWDIPSV